MKLLRQGIALAVAGAGLAVVPAIQGQAQAAEPSLVQQMKNQADGTVEVRSNPATGKIGFARAKGGTADLMPGLGAATGAQAADKAAAYLEKYGVAFGATAAQLQERRVDRTEVGWTVSYTQEYQGIDVFGSMIKANVDNSGDLTSVNGYAAPDLSLSVTPRISAADAGARAVRLVKATPASEGGDALDTRGVEARAPKLVVYRLGAVKSEAGEAILAYAVEVTNDKTVRDMVFLDAQTGKPVNRYSMLHSGLNRELYEATGTAQAPVLTRVWKEGDPFPGGLNPDQQNLVNSSGESYWLFRNAFGRDSYDGAGAIMRTVNNDPRISCPNANWNGVTTNYCNGVTSDDIVSHEWGHAYTEYTSGLIYQYQSGALNESYSDVWGETLDLINQREDEGENFTTARTVGDCETTAPPALEFEITAPAAVAGPCFAVAATGAKPFTTTPVDATVVVAVDAANTAGPSTTDGCSPFSNATTVAGKWAYVDRGTCPFATKVANAETAGATGIVIGNNNVDVPAGFTGDPDLYGAMVSQADGQRIKTAGGPVTVSVSAEDLTTRANSTRWLMGEKSTAFGGAIRDMWNPTCYGDPGKVTDVEYKCDPLNSDAGGVHSNSGVPNHAYALVVDGGAYNGQTVTALGLDKAAAIWWRAQTAYLTPQSNFIDAADALESSCADLVGAPIKQLTTAPNATPADAAPITAGDCASVAAANAATEMRTEPQRCDFRPLLQQGAPSVCGEGFASEALWTEDFEDGLAGWTASSETVYAGGLNAPWTSVASAPEGTGDPHASKVAFGPAPDQGQCSGTAGDFSSRDSITGPIVELPDNLRSPKMSFEHYVATESGYDGGNVKVSVNGGAFQAIPAAAYTFNAPGVLFTEAQGNTNPLAGEPAFTGTDGGQTKGSWGESQVDVTALGVSGGDTVQFRFDIGRDGCGGNEGWYVDNIELVQCKLAAKVSAVHVPEPSTFGQASSVKVTVERSGSVGNAPTGDVTLEKADGSVVGTGTLAGGTTTIALPADLPVGVHTLSVEYSGDATIAAASAKVTVTVKAGSGADSRTKLRIFPKKPSFRDDIKAVAKVKAVGGVKVTGKVKFVLDGKRVGSKVVDDGRAKITITKNLRVGKHKIVAVYKGSKTVDDSRDLVKFKVRR